MRQIVGEVFVAWQRTNQGIRQSPVKFAGVIAGSASGDWTCFFVFLT